MKKAIIMAGMIIGSYAGSCIPLIWGGNLFSITSIIFSLAGAFVGIYLTYKFSRGI